MSKAIRVVIAEDSPTVRRYLVTLIDETPDLEVIGEARDGAEAIRLVAEMRPDVVSMDVHMPILDGLEATRRIMTQAPTPIVIVSGLLEVDVDLSLNAITAGALAVVGKPPDRGNPNFADRHRQLITTLRAMAGVRVISRRVYHNSDRSQSVLEKDALAQRVRPQIIAVGASTGGPSALLALLNAMPKLPLPLIIAQHMPREFMPGLARWLDASTPHRVVLASHGRLLEAETVVIAPGDGHLAIARQNGRLATHILKNKPLARYQPSIDIMMDSVATVCGAAAIGVILTGMGNDGALGLLAMHKAGAITIAQDEASSTVYGMPRAAVNMGAAQISMPLPNIATKIVKLL